MNKALLAGCIAMAFSSAGWAKEIKIAVVGAMSGPVAQYGDMEFTGARQAIADITPAATNADLTTRGYQMVLRTTGLDSDQGPTAVKYILDEVKPTRIAVVHDKQQYGEGLARSVRENLNKAGVKEVMFEGVTAGDKDFSALVAKLKKENVDFVYFGGYYKFYAKRSNLV